MTDLAGQDSAALLESAAERLRAAGIPGPRREARRLLEQLLGVAPLGLWQRPDPALTREQVEAFAAVTGRRCAGEPPSRIFGEREFWSLRLVLGPHTLDPRPDSETLVAAVLAALPDRARPYRLLDLGTGSGCLLLALLSELPAAWGVGVDLEPATLAVAARNAGSLELAGRCAWVCGDWAESLDGTFDVVVSNPPYVSAAEMAALDPAVARFDPALALHGGIDGLAAYRAIIPGLRRRLAPAGVAALEIGCDQSEAVARLLEEAGFAAPALERDLGGLPRCLVARERP